MARAASQPNHGHSGRQFPTRSFPRLATTAVAIAFAIAGIGQAHAHEPDVLLKEAPQPFLGAWQSNVHPETETPFVIGRNDAHGCKLTSIAQVALSGIDETAKMLRVSEACPGYKTKEWWQWRVLNGVETLIVASPSVDAINVFVRSPTAQDRSR